MKRRQRDEQEIRPPHRHARRSLAYVRLITLSTTRGGGDERLRYATSLRCVIRPAAVVS